MHNSQFTYYPMHMHIHTCFQPGSSMANHFYNANKLGMKYIWFTDHDVRTGIKKVPVTGFSFDTGSLMKDEGNGLFCGFEVTSFENTANFTHKICTETKTLFMNAYAEKSQNWQNAGIHFVSSGARHTAALLMGVCLNLNVTAEKINPDSRLIFDIRLSQRPPSLKPAHLLYVVGSTDGLSAPHTQILPLKIAGGEVHLPISDDISDDTDIGGRDNVFDTIAIVLQVRNGACLSVSLKDFEIKVKKFFEAAHHEQKKLAAKVGNRYGVTPFVSFEISDAGEHKNCFSTCVPTIDYAEQNFEVSNMDAVKHIKKHGGIFAINHPLAIQALKRQNFSETQRSQTVAKMAACLLSNHAYGAHLIEVGFPCGRNGFSLEEYVMLWDLLSMGGLFLCGYGSSDSHRNNDGWFSGNNFATYLAAPQNLPHPISEKVFTHSMKRGMAYTGNPVKINGEVRFETTDGYQMGTIFKAEEASEVEIEFFMEHTEPGWQFRLIETGLVTVAETLPSGSFSHRSVLCAGKTTVSFQRAEVYDETGKCILLTNPIYVVNVAEAAFEIPKERLVETEERT